MAAWLGVTAGITAVLVPLRDLLPGAHAALVYLLVVLLGSARHGRTVGIALSVASFLAFNFFLLPPYGTLEVRDPLDWGVLVAFLVTGAIAAQLFHRLQRALDDAEARTRAVNRMTSVGAAGLAAPRAVDAVQAIARELRAELGVRACRIVVLRPTGIPPVVEPPNEAAEASAMASGLVEYAATEGRIVGLRANATSHVAPPGATLSDIGADPVGFTGLLVPLRVREALVGVLILEDPSGLRLDPARARFADALTPYAALAVERIRLATESEHVEALREADRLKDAMLASVSHDLRTPLTTIRALAAEIRQGGDPRAAVIEVESDRLNRMVTDLLDLSRLRAGAVPLDLQVNAAEDLVGAALQRLAGIAPESRIQVRFPDDGALIVGRFDFVQSLRALGNLVENALAHSTGEVELQVEQAGDELVFRVMDRGPGVPESERARVFEPFYSLRSASSGSIGAGAGLGLPIARSLAEAQGGSVHYTPRVGGGSVFELRLPAATLPTAPD